MNQKRAKISFEFSNCPHQFGGWCIDCFREYVNAALAEGFKAGQAAGCRKNAATPYHAELMKLGIEEGFAEAKAKAANLAEFHSGPSIQLAKKIRALRPSGSKKAKAHDIEDCAPDCFDESEGITVPKKASGKEPKA